MTFSQTKYCRPYRSQGFYGLRFAPTLEYTNMTLLLKTVTEIEVAPSEKGETGLSQIPYEGFMIYFD